MLSLGAGACQCWTICVGVFFPTQSFVALRTTPRPPSKRYMSIVKGRTASDMQYNFNPVLWGLRGTNCRSLPARFPLWGTIVSSPVTSVPGFHELLHCLLHACSSPATSTFRTRLNVYHSERGMRALRRGTATTAFGRHTSSTRRRRAIPKPILNTLYLSRLSYRYIFPMRARQRCYTTSNGSSMCRKTSLVVDIMGRVLLPALNFWGMCNAASLLARGPVL